MPVTPYSYKRFSLDDVLIDIAVRFILNCPEEDLSTLERFFFQVEEAHWFYEDFARVSHPALPHLTLKSFVESLFQAVPLLKNYIKDPIDGLSKFRSYKSVIPVRGGIILNQTLDKVLMVQPWKSKVWVFPRGKINKNESDEKCAIREVLEETGFDMGAYLVPNEYIEVTRQNKNIRLYVVKGVPESTVFETQTRKEISEIKWHRVQSLPVFSKTKKVAAYQHAVPFLHGLKQYISRARGEVSELSIQETSALKNLLGLNGQVEADQASAQRLVSMIQAPLQPSMFPPVPQYGASPVYQDRQVIMDLFKTGTSSQENIKSAQQILQLLQHEIATEEVIKTPAKIIVPASDDLTPTPGNYATPPPVPPNTMLQSLLTSRKGTNSGLLSVLGGEKPAAKSAQPAQPVQPVPPMKPENNLLSFLKTGSTMSSSGKSLMSLLKGPEPETLNASANLAHLTAPSHQSSAKNSLMAMLTKETPEKAPAAQAPANSLMDLLNAPAPTVQGQSEEQPERQPGEAESQLLGLLKGPDTAVSAEPVASTPEPQRRSASVSLMELLNGPKEEKPKEEKPEVPATNVSLMGLLKSSPPETAKTEEPKIDEKTVHSPAGSELMNLLSGDKNSKSTTKSPASASPEPPKQEAVPAKTSQEVNLMDLLKPRDPVAENSAQTPDSEKFKVSSQEGNANPEIDAAQPAGLSETNENVSARPPRESSPAASSLMSLLQSSGSSSSARSSAVKQKHASGSVSQYHTEPSEPQSKSRGDETEFKTVERVKKNIDNSKEADQKPRNKGTRPLAANLSKQASPSPSTGNGASEVNNSSSKETKLPTLRKPSKPPLLSRYSRDTPKGDPPALTDGYPTERDLVRYLRQVLEIA